MNKKNCRNIRGLQGVTYFGQTYSIPLMGFFSVSLSLYANFGPNRYHYPAYCTKAVTNHPLSRLQSSARGPVLSLPRS